MDKYLDINPQTKIGELLDTYPQLEEVLLSISQSFAKLKNPVLRRTVGRVASLRQAAQIGGIDVGEMVSILRKAIGMDEIVFDNSCDTDISSRPDWVNVDKVSITFDAIPIIENGASPMKDIISNAEKLENGQLMLLIAPFKPIPIIELLASKGYDSWSTVDGDKINTYLRRED